MILSIDLMRQPRQHPSLQEFHRTFRWIYCFFITILVVSYIIPLSREFSESYLSYIRYVTLPAFVFFMYFVSRNLSGSGGAIFGMFFFVFFTTVFTGINYPDVVSLLTIAGYLLLLFAYCVYSTFNIGLSYVTLSVFAYVGCFFSAINLFYINNTESYSYFKNQFTGALENPNAFAGLCGLFVIFCIWKLYDRNQISIYRFVFFINAMVLLSFMIMTFSRGAIISLFIAGIFIGIPFRHKLITLLMIVSIILVALGFIIEVPGNSYVNRSFLEETGRQALFSLYTEEILDNSLLLGTGLSEGGGRIKAELAYLDVLLFSGIGAFGFALFWIISVKTAIQARTFPLGRVASAIVIYVCTLSIFEGYLANVNSLLTILAYISAGICYRERDISLSLNRTLRSTS